MPLVDDKDIEDRNSSADLTDEQDAAALSADIPVDAAPSTATGETEDEGSLSVVRDVVAQDEPEDQAASPAEGEETVEAAAGAEGENDEDDYSDVPFSAHPRFKQLIREKNDWRKKARQIEQTAQTFSVDAERYRNVQNFMDQNGLVAEEAADLLVIGGLMKTDPVEAWKRARPTIQKLLIAAGEVLPPELQQRVRQGELSHAAALEVSRAHAARQSVQATRSFEQRRNEQLAQRNAITANQQAAEMWQAERQEKDPNFAAKLPQLMREVTFLQRTEGVPNTPDGVKAQLQKAYASIVPAGKPAQPRAEKKSVTPVRGGSVAGNQRPAEMSTLDIIRSHTRA